MIKRLAAALGGYQCRHAVSSRRASVVLSMSNMQLLVLDKFVGVKGCGIPDQGIGVGIGDKACTVSGACHNLSWLIIADSHILCHLCTWFVCYWHGSLPTVGLYDHRHLPSLRSLSRSVVVQGWIRYLVTSRQTSV